MKRRKGKKTLKRLLEGNGRRMVRVKVKHKKRSSCGTCTLCCTILAVGDKLQKRRHKVCKHVCETCNNGKPGCNIYKDKPEECTVFKCGWLLGWPQVPASKRPDRCGVVTWAERTSSGETMMLDGESEEALRQPWVRTMIRECTEVYGRPACVMLKGRERELYLPGSILPKKVWHDSRDPEMKYTQDARLSEEDQ